MKKIKVCAVTGGRADYGIFLPLLQRLRGSEEFHLDILVTGYHLRSQFGNTWKAIERDGFRISGQVPLVNEGEDSETPISTQVSRAINGLSREFSKIKPDLVLLVGDRYETLAAAQAAVFLKIPIAHIHGGEISLGALDELFRHAITKLSHFHFVTNEEHKNRVIQMGEIPERVFSVGALGLETIQNMPQLDRQEFERLIGFQLREKNFLITYHPTTMDDESGHLSLIEALKEFGDVGQIISIPNSDPGYSGIIESIGEYSQGRKNVCVVSSLGHIGYANALRIVDVVVGNSSSGIIEAPFLGTPTVDIGSRQEGRSRAESVLNSRPEKDQIVKSIRHVLNTKFERSSLYGDGNSSQKIVKVLQDINLGKSFKKRFYDLRQENEKK